MTRPRMNVDELRAKTLAAIEAAGVKRRGPPPAPDTLQAAVFILVDHGLPTGEIALALDRSESYVSVIKSRLRKLAQRPRTEQTRPGPVQRVESTVLNPKFQAHLKRIGVLSADGEINVGALHTLLEPLRSAAASEQRQDLNPHVRQVTAHSIAAESGF